MPCYSNISSDELIAHEERMKEEDHIYYEINKGLIDLLNKENPGLHGFRLNEVIFCKLGKLATVKQLIKINAIHLYGDHLQNDLLYGDEESFKEAYAECDRLGLSENRDKILSKKEKWYRK